MKTIILPSGNAFGVDEADRRCTSLLFYLILLTSLLLALSFFRRPIDRGPFRPRTTPVHRLRVNQLPACVQLVSAIHTQRDVRSLY
jgi:hypothetical protein